MRKQSIIILQEKPIISSVLFEYTQHGALIHYFATISMKKSSFTQQFVLEELKDNNLETYINTKCQDWNVKMKKLKDCVMLLLDEGEDAVSGCIRLALSSKASMAIIPLQDILRLNYESRMNTPGTTSNNWKWEFSWDDLLINQMSWFGSLS